MFGFWMKNRSGTLQPLGKRDFEFWIFDVGWKRKNRSGTLQPLGKRDFGFWIFDFGWKRGAKRGGGESAEEDAEESFGGRRAEFR
jgi:hypothetical protein